MTTRLTLLLTLLLTGAVTLHAQPQVRLTPPSAATLPTACAVGDLATKTGEDAGLYVCTATNAWTLVGSGGSTFTLGLPGAPTANQTIQPATSTTGDGANLALLGGGGDPVAGYDGGAIEFQAGNAFVANSQVASGASVVFLPGSVSGGGGDLSFLAGYSGIGDLDGGDIELTGGAASGSGTPGKIKFHSDIVADAAITASGFKTDTVDGHTAALAAYDTDTGNAATADISSGGNGTVTTTVTLEGLAGNAYTIEVVVGVGNDVALAADLSGTAITVTLGTDSSGDLDPAKNTATLVAAAIDSLAGVTSVASGDGTTALAAAEGPHSFTGGAGSYVDFITLTNGTTPTAVVTAPTGTTLSIDATEYKVGGVSGLTVSGTSCTITAITGGLITGATCTP